jgi:hypothetical protein
MKVSYLDDIERHGFAVFEDFVDSETLEHLLQELANARIDMVESQRGGKSFGIVYESALLLARASRVHYLVMCEVGQEGTRA